MWFQVAVYEGKSERLEGTDRQWGVGEMAWDTSMGWLGRTELAVNTQDEQRQRLLPHITCDKFDGTCNIGIEKQTDSAAMKRII